MKLRTIVAVFALATLAGLAACERIVDLIGVPDGGIFPGSDAGSGVGAGSGLDAGAVDAPSFDEDSALPGDGGIDAGFPSLDAPFVGPVRTRT